jgi:hypothetical protein
MIYTSLLRVILLLFFLFISCGHLFRIIPVPYFSNSMNLIEILLHTLSLLALPLLPLSTFTLGSLSILWVAILSSFIYGCSLHGWDPIAALYALRLCFLCSTSVVLCAIFSFFFESNLISYSKFAIKAYGIALLLSTLIHIFFPKSQLLWHFLQERSIDFHGDPHIGRFVSVYFDPNFYASIAPIPFFLASFLSIKTKQRRYQILALAFALSTLLTWSRSGILTFFIQSVYLLYIYTKKKQKLTKAVMTYSSIALSIITTLCFLYRHECLYFIERTLFFLQEDSALCRIKTFSFGKDLLQQAPLFGLGINFLYPYTEKAFNLTSVDSSLLALLIQIGLLPGALLLYSLGEGVRLCKRRIAQWHKIQPQEAQCLSALLFYGLSILLFTSQFNNILFYPLWFLPFFTTLLFFLKASKKEESLRIGGANHRSNILSNSD